MVQLTTSSALAIDNFLLMNVLWRQMTSDPEVNFPTADQPPITARL